MNFANKQSISRLFDALARWKVGAQRIVIELLVKMGYGGSLIFRSMTVGNWGWMRALLMILLFLVGMAGVIFVVHEI
jgi:hypothetical protein